MIQFGDSAAGAHAIPYDYAALYSADCDYPADKAEAALKYDKGHARWITFHGDPHSSILDFEPGTRAYQDPALVRTWLLDRATQPDMRRSWLYCDLSNAAKAAHYARGHAFQWWLATLDGVRRSQRELSELLRHFGVPIEQSIPSLIAAHQWKTVKNESALPHLWPGDYDADICFTDADW